MEEEVWKPIKDYEGLYEVSNLGRVKTLNYRGTGKGKILKNIECSNGYLTIGLTKNGKRKLFTVHRLVAEAFIPNTEGKPCIDHINTIKNDNRVENLRWLSVSDNCWSFGYYERKEHRKKKVRATNGEKTMIFPSRTDTAKYFGLSKSRIEYGRVVQKGKMKGWIFELVEDIV